jgi:IclR family transcriptional regulator, pca regulon regulatory protein
VPRHGWAILDQELEDGLRSVAVPIRDATGAVVAAMNLSTQASRRTPAGIRRELLPPLRKAAGAIEADLAAGRVP